MTSNIPAKLKAVDITRFAQRAAQLEKVKPVAAYWCEFHIVNQILNKGLHTADDECMAYTTTLMDKLEHTKTREANNDAIIDDLAAQAYMEQFALETFQRADNAVRANKASAQTADTFRAAATFLDLLSTWGAPSEEFLSKSKYAKYHALRIAKALKAGEDPNLSNPKQEPTPKTEEVPLDPNDPDVQKINGISRPPYVEDYPEHRQSSSPFSETRISTAATPSIQNARSPNVTMGDVSPLEQSPIERQGLGGGEYFPQVPTFTSESSAPGLPTAPPDDGTAASPTAPVFIDQPPQNFYQTSPISQPAIFPQSNIPPAPAPSTQTNTNRLPLYRTDDEAILMAQKHAKWAISALNFEDVETAVKELRIALQSLGAR
ncbi:DUF605-domain-containing protein [Patellaria atrata CBS 101060]|uniref:DUF605-domain-containing protein n=1 Tax=Patellaria atrata CBS 101060 TaxID=1346257 RepID=A0A9P4S557_9PEZI|nr:DUF605-domain-containing protein [Patellaria atrata CBS 101060]